MAMKDKADMQAQRPRTVQQLAELLRDVGDRLETVVDSVGECVNYGHRHINLIVGEVDSVSFRRADDLPFSQSRLSGSFGELESHIVRMATVIERLAAMRDNELVHLLGRLDELSGGESDAAKPSSRL